MLNVKNKNSVDGRKKNSYIEVQNTIFNVSQPPPLFLAPRVFLTDTLEPLFLNFRVGPIDMFDWNSIELSCQMLITHILRLLVRNDLLP